LQLPENIPLEFEFVEHFLVFDVESEGEHKFVDRSFDIRHNFFRERNLAGELLKNSQEFFSVLLLPRIPSKQMLTNRVTLKYFSMC